jgi:prepilin-type N-terminal cleavage/methylation domain-containing protein
MSIDRQRPFHTTTLQARRAARSDGGFTLPELLITVAIMGTLIAVMSTAMLVMLRTTPRAELRLAESKDITFLQTWVPVDLSSAINSYDDPDDAVVKAQLLAQEPSISLIAELPGTNVLTLVAPDLTAPDEYKIISYRYLQRNGKWQLARYRISNPGVPGTGLNSEQVSPVGVAYEIPGPPEDGSWTEDMVPPQKPIHAFEITSRNQVVLRPIGENVTVKFKSGNVFSTGGAGMSAEKDLTPNDPVTLPDPTAPPTRCGGSIALVLDTSYSVPGYDGGEELEVAAAGLIDAFQGTPTTLTVMGFDAIAYSLYPNLNGTRGEYISLLNPSSDIENAKFNVLALPNVDTPYQGYNSFQKSGSYYYGPTGSGRDNNGNTGSGLGVGWTKNRVTEHGQNVSGSTNWEDALHAPFFDQDGNQRPVTPETVILITDGDPNTDRRAKIPGVADNGLNYVDAAALAANNGRATGARIIGVLVGGGNTGSLESNLGSVVGGNKWNGSVNADGTINLGNAVAADYFASNFDQLGPVLRSIMAAQCGGTVTIQKEINGGVASGQWNYSTDTGGSTLDLDLAGSVTFDYIFETGVTTREVVITEEVKSGYIFDRADCYSAGAKIVDPSLIRSNDDGTPGVTLVIQPDQAVSCTMYSNPE